MPVENLNHINIKAPRPLIDEVKDFYVNIIGLAAGKRPNVSLPGYWLYAGDNAIVHLMDTTDLTQTDSTGAAPYLDHFAFTCSDIDAMETRFKAGGVTYRRNDIPEYGFSQLFLQDPTGLGVELNFAIAAK